MAYPFLRKIGVSINARVRHLYSPSPRFSHSSIREDRVLHQGIWHEISFYNFVQFPVYKNRRPTRLEFKKSQDLFFQVLKKLKPTIVWACGKTLWKNLPDENYEDLDVFEGVENGFYYFDNNKARIIPSIHPSLNGRWGRKFEISYWSPILRKFMTSDFPTNN